MSNILKNRNQKDFHFGNILYVLILMQVLCKNKTLQYEVYHTKYYTAYANVSLRIYYYMQ